jgi:hypothetical protein
MSDKKSLGQLAFEAWAEWHIREDREWRDLSSTEETIWDSTAGAVQEAVIESVIEEIMSLRQEFAANGSFDGCDACMRLLQKIRDEN